MLMMKGLLLLNVNNTVLHFCMSKRRSKRVKNLTKKVRHGDGDTPKKSGVSDLFWEGVISFTYVRVFCTIHGQYSKLHVNNLKYSKIFECTLQGKRIFVTHDGRTYVSACIHNNLTHACYICAQSAPVCRMATVLVVRMQARCWLYACKLSKGLRHLGFLQTIPTSLEWPDCMLKICNTSSKRSTFKLCTTNFIS
jgi:hypothetical protein